MLTARRYRLTRLARRPTIYLPSATSRNKPAGDGKQHDRYRRSRNDRGIHAGDAKPERTVRRAGVRIFITIGDREVKLARAAERARVMLDGFAADAQRESSSDQTYDRLSANARAGHVIGGRIFGYRNVDVFSGKCDRDGRPIKSHCRARGARRRATIVRRILDYYGSGWGLVRIAKHLNDEGTPWRRQPKPDKP